MREIKFRAWDTQNERMVVPYFFEECPNHNGQDYRYYEDWRDMEDGRSFECELMQFTGITDKKGNEIWEGDILGAKFYPQWIERKGWEGPPDAICTVYWDHNGFRLKAVGQDDTRYVDFTDFEKDEHCNELFVDMCSEETEVLGNIYENPELLKESA